VLLSSLLPARSVQAGVALFIVPVINLLTLQNPALPAFWFQNLGTKLAKQDKILIVLKKYSIIVG